MTQMAAVACGQLPVPVANTNVTLSITSRTSTAECTQQVAVTAGRGSQASCSRCPTLVSSTAYTVLLVPASNGQDGGTASVEVRSQRVAHLEDTPLLFMHKLHSLAAATYLTYPPLPLTLRL